MNSAICDTSIATGKAFSDPKRPNYSLNTRDKT